MGNFFIDIVVDEGIYSRIKSRINFDGKENERIIAKTSWGNGEIIQYCFVYYSADNLEALEKYIQEIKDDLGELQFNKVKEITVHDSVLNSIVEELQDKQGKEIVKYLQKKYGLKYFYVCSQVEAVSKVLKNKPISRDKHMKSSWEKVCGIEEIQKVLKEGKPVLGSSKVYKDDDYVYFKSLLIEILIWWLPKFWGEVDEELYRREKFKAIEEDFEKYTNTMMPESLSEDEKNELYDTSLSLLNELQSDDDFRKSYDTLLSFHKELNCSRKITNV